MKTLKKALIWALALSMVLALAACGGTADAPQSTAATQTGTEPAAPAAPKILKLAVNFAYPSLDTHKEYYGWYTSVYGVTENLFRMDDNSAVVPLLAKSATPSEDGLTWTVELNDNVTFSNGTPLTAQMVVRNLRRAGEVNSRFEYLKDFDIQAQDDTTLTITTPSIYPTMLNDLASPELGILDLDGTTDFDNAPVGTGPFVVKSFVPEGDVEVCRNENYWNGEVQLDGVTFYYMQQDEPKLMAMQNGEIDGYSSVTAAAMEIYKADPASYKLTEIPATRLQWYILYQERLDDAVRAAVNLTVDPRRRCGLPGGHRLPRRGPLRPLHRLRPSHQTRPGPRQGQ